MANKGTQESKVKKNGEDPHPAVNLDYLWKNKGAFSDFKPPLSRGVRFWKITCLYPGLRRPQPLGNLVGHAYNEYPHSNVDHHSGHKIGKPIHLRLPLHSSFSIQMKSWTLLFLACSK